MAGRKLGPRVFKKYTDDASNEYRMQVDQDFATATELGFGADNPALRPMPVRSKMRHVYGTATISGVLVRKKLPCGNFAATAYTGASTTVTIDGVVFTVAGHVGEIMPYKGA